MSKIIWKVVGLAVLSAALILIIAFSEKHDCTLGGTIAGILVAFSLEGLWHSIQDLSDTTDWKSTQRKLGRGGFIDQNTIVRISFAYLFRIKVGNEYLLVKNERGTGKYQPVGGVYKLHGGERTVLNNLYHVVDDNKVPIDESSRDDYRLRMANRYLRKFVRRFNNKADREKVSDVSREFKEELIEKGILGWRQIKYRYCGRHMKELKFSEHFLIYELLLADIVDIMPTEKQLADLQRLKNTPSAAYWFATAEQITSLGIVPGTNSLNEWIGDHTQKILQENEHNLMRTPDTGKVFTVEL